MNGEIRNTMRQQHPSPVADFDPQDIAETITVTESAGDDSGRMTVVDRLIYRCHGVTHSFLLADQWAYRQGKLITAGNRDPRLVEIQWQLPNSSRSCYLDDVHLRQGMPGSHD
jgi:hypothetical protein